MRISEAFPGKYLKAAHLRGQTVTVTMSHVEMERIRDSTELVLYFIGKELGLVLNKTNRNTLSLTFGDETDLWRGHQIELYGVMTTRPDGTPIPGLRVRPAPRPPQAVAEHGEMVETPAPAPAPAPRPPQTNGAAHAPPPVASRTAARPAPPMVDDEIPF